MFRSYLSNKIGSVGLGLYGLILQIYSFAVTFTASGISLAVTRLVSENIQSDRSNIRKIIRTCIIISTCVSSITGLFLFCFAQTIGTFILNDQRTVLSIRILSFSLPFLAVSACLRGYFYGVRKVIISASEQVVEQLVEILVFIALIGNFVVKGINFACAAIVIGTTVAEIVSCIYSSLLYYADVKTYSKHASVSFTKEILCIAVPVTASACINSGLSMLENTLVPSGLQRYGFSQDRALSSYGIISEMVGPLLSFPGGFLLSVAMLLVPEISESNHSKRKKDVKRISLKIIKLTSAFSLITMLGFALFGDVISIAVYKNNSCGLYLKIFSPLVPLMYVDTIADAILKGLNDQVKTLSYNMVNSILRVCGTLILLPILGIAGEIIVIFVSTVLGTYFSMSRLFELLMI